MANYDYDFDLNDSLETSAKKETIKAFEESYAKSRKATILTCSIMFGSFFVLFFALAFVMYFVEQDMDGTIALSIMSFVMLLSLFIVLVATPKNVNYDKYMERTRKLGGFSTYDLLLRIEMLEKRIDYLEKEVDKLKNK